MTEMAGRSPSRQPRVKLLGVPGASATPDRIAPFITPFITVKSIARLMNS